MSAIKIKRIQVINLRAILNEELSLNGCSVIVVGGNNKGKTTLTRALMDRFKGIKSEYIVNYDALEGSYKMELTNGEVLHWQVDTNGKEKLTITADGKREKITKEIMECYFPNTFDVDKFLNETPGKQRKVLEKLTGLDFTDIDKAYAEAYETRTYYNKRVKEDEAIKVQWEPHWKEEIQDTSAIQKELDEIDRHNLNYETIRLKLQQKQTNLKWLQDRIEQLKTELANAEESAMQLETEIDKGTIWLNNPDKQPKTEEYKQQVKAKLLDVEANNDVWLDMQNYNKNKQYAEQADAAIKKILSDKDEMIRLADMPDGFGFDNEGITYNGLPFNKKTQSSSALTIGALKLAVRVIGRVMTLHFDASYLDKNSLLQVQEWAENNNLQLLIERPDWEDGPIRYEIIEQQ